MTLDPLAEHVCTARQVGLASSEVTSLDFHCGLFSLIKAIRNARPRPDLNLGGKVQSPPAAEGFQSTRVNLCFPGFVRAKKHVLQWKHGCIIRTGCQTDNVMMIFPQWPLGVLEQ